MCGIAVQPWRTVGVAVALTLSALPIVRAQTPVGPPPPVSAPAPAFPVAMPPAAPPPPAEDPVPTESPSAADAGAQATADAQSSTGGERLIALKFNQAPVPQVLQFYADLTGRTLLESPNITAVITLRSQSKLTVEESLQAIKTVLAMNNIGLVTVGKKFVKVVPIPTMQQEGLAIRSGTGLAEPGETDDMISEIIPLKYIEYGDAQKAVSVLIHSYGKIQPLERINSLLVADTALNITRIKQVLSEIDQPLDMKEELHVIRILHAKASDVKTRLEEIMAENKAQDKQPSVAAPRTSGPPGVIRAPKTGDQPARTETAAAASTLDQAQAEGRIFRGQVRIVADDRTGVLIIITRAENMRFFENVVKALDVRTDPDVVVRVFRLEYAEAEGVAGMLNELIGAQTTAKETPKTAEGTRGMEGKSSTLTEYTRQREQTPAPSTPSPSSAPSASRAGGARTKVGELAAENIKILSDKRTNALIVMASKSDMITIEDLIKQMDLMLSQVLIEGIILDVNLGDEFRSGADWFQRSMIAYDVNADGSREALGSFAGGGGGGTRVPQDATTMFADQTVGGGLTYYFTHFALNMDVVVQMVKSDTRARVLSSPVILTMDNKEAKIDAGTERYFYKGARYTGSDVDSGGRYIDDVETRKVGLTLTVTPHINQQRFVVMDIAQKTEAVVGEQTVNDEQWPVVASRDISASVAVRSGETIILGGLMENAQSDSKSGIPILSDIPLVGLLFRSTNLSKNRRELVIFITPYVVNSPEEQERESKRIKESTDASGLWQKGWSNSRMAEPPPQGIKRFWRNLFR